MRKSTRKALKRGRQRMSSNAPQNITVDPSDPRQALALLDRLVGDLSFNRQSHDVIRQAVATLNGTIQTAETHTVGVSAALTPLHSLKLAIQTAFQTLPAQSVATGDLLYSFNRLVELLPIAESENLKLNGPIGYVDAMPKEASPAHSESDISRTGSSSIESSGQT